MQTTSICRALSKKGRYFAICHRNPAVSSTATFKVNPKKLLLKTL